MKSMRAYLAGLTLVASTATITAAVISQEHEDPDDLARMYSDPGPEHDVLDRFAGKWDWAVTVWATPDSEPTKVRLTADYRWQLGGRFLQGEFEGYLGGELFQGREVLGYDRFRKQFNDLWIDNKTTGFQLATGHYEERGRTLIFEGVDSNIERDVADQRFRISYKFRDDDRIEINVSREGEDGRMHRRAKVQATRAD